MKKLSTDSKSELVILQEKEQRIQQEIDAIESRLNSLKRVSNLLRLVEKCGAWIQDPNHNSILGLEDELRADKTELNKIKERIEQIKNAPTNASVTSSNSQNIQNSSSSFTLTEKIIAIAVVIIVCFLVLDNYSGFYESDYDSVSEKYGFVNIFNRVKIPYEYEKIAYDNGRNDSFSDKICWVKKDGFWGAINKRNKVIVPFEYEADDYLKTDELSEFTKNGKHGLITEEGEILIPFEYDKAFDFDENNITLAIKDGKVGAISINNEITIPFEYEAITNNPAATFKEDEVVFLEKNNKIGAINKNGEIVIPFEYDLAYKKTTLYYDGEPYTHYYTRLNDFYDYGVIVLKKNNKCGVLDANNNIVISFEYDKIFFIDNTFHAYNSKGTFEFDVNGNLIELY